MNSSPPKAIFFGGLGLTMAGLASWTGIVRGVRFLGPLSLPVAVLGTVVMIAGGDIYDSITHPKGK